MLAGWTLWCCPMTASPADVAYATYMLQWIDRLEWPSLPVADESLPALRAFWTESADTDLAAIDARLWAWVDANGGADSPTDKSMILARMLLCLAAVPNRQLQQVGYFEELLGNYGVPRAQIQAALPARPGATAAAAAALPNPTGPHEQQKTQLLWAFGVVSFVSGAHAASAAVSEMAQAIDLGLVFAMISLIFLWYRIDADQYGFKRTVFMNVSIVMVAAIAVPYYLIRSRGWQHGQIAVLKAVLVFLGSIALSALGGMLFGQPPG